MKKWSCKEVAKWIAEIEGMPNNVCATFLRNDVIGTDLLSMQHENFKDIGMTKAGPLALLLKEISSLSTEAIFVEQSAYCFQKILDILQLRAMCQNEYTLPTSVHIQFAYKKRSEKIVDYYFAGESSSFILQGREINSTIFSDHHTSLIESWLSEDGVSGDLDLLYRGSRDGWKTLYFHAKCDNKGETIAVIRSNGGFIFGGFADKSCKSFGDWCKSEKYFLFS